MMVRVIAAVFVFSAASAHAQYEPPLIPVPAFDPSKHTMMQTDDGTCACTMEYNPMCAKPPEGEKKTYPNECHAACEKAELVSLGPC